MINSSHISLETLVDIVEGRATSAALEGAVAHITSCSDCVDTLRRLQQVIFTMKTDTGPDAPRDLLHSAINIFSPEKRSPLRHIIAILTFDSRVAGPAYGIRSLRSSSRQLLYSAQDTDLDLRVTVQNDECIVTGQVIRADCVNGQVEISGDAGSATASLNEVCEFTLPAIPLGNYALRINMPDVQIEIPELELKD
ncbi:MAG TPA: hypothetical protein VGP59_01475 [Pyrinomonadaceae bacterium]|jgi:hypothetical protein|nr:hypothetical protein [Pyrinomonadaceae bacterium]